MTLNKPNISEKKVLDLGCGANKTPGAVGMDRFPSQGVDVVHDMKEFPWPFEDNTFTEVRLSQILEHVPDVLHTMEEIYRICKPGAKVLIWTPHFSSPNSWTDPTHCQHLAYRTMDLFTEGARYEYTTVRFKIESQKITFGKSLLCWPGRLLVALSPDWYERHFCYLFPARDLEFVLSVVK